MRTRNAWLTCALAIASCNGDDAPQSAPATSSGAQLSSSSAESTAIAAPSSSSTGSTGETTAADLCDQAPVLTYETFGQGFLRAHCQGCHGSEVANRQGAPADVVFDTREDAMTWSARIAARVLTEEEGTSSMPPAGGVTQDERARLQIWLNCFPE